VASSAPLDVTAGSASAAPVRLLVAQVFGQFTEEVPCYEQLPAGSYVDIPFETYMSQYTQDTAVISYRRAPKAPGACPVPPELVEYVSAKALQEGIKYLWLDWSCAPQHPLDMAATMREINRSGHYYATARGFYVWCFEGRVTEQSFTHNDYITRAWTLSERLHRARTKGALRAQDLLPSSLGELFAAGAPPLERAEQYGPMMAKISMAVVKGAGIGFADREGDGMDANTLHGVCDLLIKRYPLLHCLAEALNGPLRPVLQPHALAAMHACLRLLVIIDWMARPNASFDDMTRAFMMQPLHFKAYLMLAVINDGRKQINNFMLRGLDPLEGDLLQEVWGNFDQFLDKSTGQCLDMRAAMDPLETLWRQALGASTNESMLSPAWLRRYLTFEVGSSYKAFAPPDLLFAIYKLFMDQDYVYGQEAELYAALVAVAQCRFIGHQAGGPYAWLKELTDLTEHDDEGCLVSSHLHTTTNSRTDPADALSPSNFGILSLGRSPPSTLPPGSPRGLTQLPIPELFGRERSSLVFTHVLGFRLDPEAQFALSQLAELSVVPKGSGEIDSQLSLRGRESLGRFETKLHAAIRKSFGGQAWSEACGLFVVVRYGTMKCLSKCMVLRTSCQAAGETGEQWALEQLTAFGSEAQKGSSWGIARSLELLVKDIFSLPGTKEAAYAAFGIAEIPQGIFGLHMASSEHFVPPETAQWFSTTPLGFAMNRDAPAIAESAPPPQPQPPQPPVVQPPADETPTSGQADAATDAAPGAGADAAVIPSIPPGKTTGGDDELQLIQKTYTAMVLRDLDNEGMNAYYAVLNRNRVYDRDMAKQLGYYAKVAGLYAQHLEEHGKLLVKAAPLCQLYNYMGEDLVDAIDIAEDNGVGEEVLEAARAAMHSLNTVLEKAQDD